MAPRTLTKRAVLNPTQATRVRCLTVEDYGTQRHSAFEFFSIADKRDVSLAARLCSQFDQHNRSALSLMDCRVSSTFDGARVSLVLTSGRCVGAIPLRSPTNALYDLGLVVKPRFAWAGIGPMLGEMGWTIVPKTLKLPIMQTSERRVPPWVLSSMILHRIKRLLDTSRRRFELIQAVRNTPVGHVNWAEYAVNQLSRADVLSIPCSYPDLIADRSFRSAIRFTLERQLGSLGTQRGQGRFVHQLIDFCQTLLDRVRDVPAAAPSQRTLQTWLRSTVASEALLEGLQAIEWTADERGLAGLSDLSGLPWALSMDQFFEAWVETVFRQVARYASLTVKTGRKRETVRSIAWDHAYLGSQKSLIPDLVLERSDLTLIVDAKYKRHWEELRETSWKDFQQEMQEAHRHDLMQALAYANISNTKHTITCLAYPCSIASWEDMKRRKRVIHNAVIPVGDRSLQVWLIAVPMGLPVKEVAPVFIEALQHCDL